MRALCNARQCHTVTFHESSVVFLWQVPISYISSKARCVEVRRSSYRTAADWS